jgi:hypothetical protein
MTHVFVPHPTAIGTPTGVLGAIRSLHAAAFTLVVAVVVFNTVAMANLPVARWLDSSPGRAEQEPAARPLEPAAALLPAAGEGAANARTRTRCEACGVVQAIRRIEPAGALPASYEFTVRLRDGSIRLSSNTSQGKWRMGDAIMLIGGTAPITKY